MPAALSLDDSTLPSPNTLETVRQDYQYNYTHIPPIAMVDRLPDGEQFSEEWFWLLAAQLRALFINTLVTNRGNRAQTVRDTVRQFVLEALFKGALPARLSVAARLLEVLPQVLLKQSSQNPQEFHEIDKLLFSILKAKGLQIFEDVFVRLTNLLYQGQPTGHATSLKDYDVLFSVLPVPEISQTFQQDEAFAHLQVAGYNPLMLQRISYPGDRFPVQEDQYQAVMGTDDSLAAAGQEGRLYLADYSILDHALNGTYPGDQKYVYAPLALFAVPRGADPARRLRPVAIQGGPIPGADFPIITPQSGTYRWLAAKTIVQIADANFHEPVSHLARTHLLVGAFVMATHRQLPNSHPLSLLLRPHFAGTLAINDAAQRILIAPYGGVDRLLSSTIDNSRVLAVRGLQSYSFNQAILPKQLHIRGVDDPALLPLYPYRDDALLVWDAIHRWVTDYLSLYYLNEDDVQHDRALQAWATEITSYDGGRVYDFGEAGRIQTRQYLIDAVTLIIFTASAQHADVNFPQKDVMGYAPAVSMGGYLPATILKQAVSEQDYLNILAPLDQAQRQYNLLALLGSVYYTKLGEYPLEHFSDPRVKPVLQSFHATLQQV